MKIAPVAVFVAVCAAAALLTASVSALPSTCPSDSGTNFFSQLPSNCTNVTACRVPACSCLGGTLSSDGQCTNLTLSCGTAMYTCFRTYFSCIVSAAEYAGNSVSENECENWGTGIKMALLDYALSPFSYSNTTLYKSCASALCQSIAFLQPTCNATSYPYGDVCIAPPTTCQYECPDRTCAANITSCACTSGAAVSGQAVATSLGELTTLDVTREVRFTSSASYRQASGSCSGFDFSPLLRYQWYVYANGSAVSLGTIPSDRPSISFPSRFFVGGTEYSVRVRLLALFESQNSMAESNFTAVTPLPRVSATQLGAVRRVGSGAIYLPLSIVDPLGDTTTAVTWSCAVNDTGAACPTSITTALAGSNASRTGASIGGPVAAGTYVITATYKTVSSSVTVTVVADAIPSVAVVTVTRPMAPPKYFASVQKIDFLASVVYSGNTTLEWFVNGVSSGTSRILSVDASTLTASSVTTVDGATENTIRLVARASLNADLYGEATIGVVIAPAASVALAALTNVDNSGASTVLAQRERLQFSITPTPSTAPFGAILTYTIGYWSTKREPLKGTGTGSSLMAVAPIATATESTPATVTFFASVFYNELRVASANRTFTVALPPVAELVSAQKAALAGATTPEAKAAASKQLLELASLSTNATEAAELRKEGAKSLVASMSSLPPEEALGALSAFAATVSASPETAASLNATAVADSLNDVLSQMTEIQPGDAKSVLDVITSVNTTSKADVVGNVGSLLLSSVPLGESVTVSSNGMTMEVSALSSDAIAAGATVGGSEGSLETSGALPGVNPGETVGIIGINYDEDPFGGEGTGGAALSSKVVSFSVKVNGEDRAISGVEPPLLIRFESSDPVKAVCRYKKRSTGTWESDGLTKVDISGNTVTCASTHLTEFGGFTGSAMQVALSLLVLAVAAALQVVLSF